MKQIVRLKYFLLSAGVILSALASLSVMQPQVALAVGCGEYDPEITTPQMENTRKCIEEYKTQCRKDFPDNKAKCNRMTDDQITECGLGRDTNKLDRSCFLALSNTPSTNPGGCSDCDGSGIGSDRDENDCKDTYENLDESNCGIIEYVLLISNVLAGIAGLVIVGAMIWGGIQYSMAGADPSKVQAAKQKIINALIALLLFVFGFALIQWLVPGGIF